MCGCPNLEALFPMPPSNTASSDPDHTAAKDDHSSDKESVDLSVSVPDCNPRYQIGEQVLAKHGDFYYSAKVQRAESRTNGWTYHVHYVGWKKKWDEWVGNDRMMKFTAANAKKHMPPTNYSAMGRNIKSGLSSTAVKGRRHNESISKEKGAIPAEKLLDIQIPPSLKKQLLDDCEFVTHLGKFVPLPRTPNVDVILKKYHAYRVKKDSMLPDAIQEILSGLRCYFDKALPALLLYQSERQQYKAVIVDNVSPSTVYGAEHLLRLFGGCGTSLDTTWNSGKRLGIILVKLPEILCDAKIEDETLMKVHEKILDFLKFLQKNQSALFLSSYETDENMHTSIK